MALVREKDGKRLHVTTGGGTRSRHIYTIGLEIIQNSEVIE